MQNSKCRLKCLRLMSMVCVTLILTACGAPAAIPQTPTPTAPRAPISAPTITSSPLPMPATATALPTATSMPTQITRPTSTEAPSISVVVLSAQLSATVAAQLPPTSTPDASGMTMGGFSGVNVLPLKTTDGQSPLWMAFTYGMRSFDPQRNHFVSIYTHDETGWQQLTRFDLEAPDYIDPGSIQQVAIDPNHIWLEVQSGVGAHGGCYDLLMLDGSVLTDTVQNCAGSPGAGSVADVNGDGQLDVVLDQTDAYVFCYACGVRFPGFRVLRWNGQRLVEVQLTLLPDSAPAELRQPINRAVELAQAGLWKDALAAVDQAAALNASDETANWDAALIRLQVKALQDQINNQAYPLLDNLFYGDYPAVLNGMRSYSPEQLFGPDTPLITGTVAEGWADSVTYWVTSTTTSALKVEPNLAAAYFIQGWGLHLADPASKVALADIEKAAQLDPNEPLYSQSLAYLRK